MNVLRMKIKNQPYNQPKPYDHSNMHNIAVIIIIKTASVRLFNLYSPFSFYNEPILAYPYLKHN